MQEIATTNAKADVEREGKKYGNLQQDLCFDNDNQHLNKAEKKFKQKGRKEISKKKEGRKN